MSDPLYQALQREIDAARRPMETAGGVMRRCQFCGEEYRGRWTAVVVSACKRPGCRFQYRNTIEERRNGSR